MYAEAATGGYGDASITGVCCVSSVRGDTSAGGSTTTAFSTDRVLTSAHHNSLSFHNKFAGVLNCYYFISISI